MKQINKNTKAILEGLILLSKQHVKKIDGFCEAMQEVLEIDGVSDPNFIDEISDIIYGDHDVEVLMDRLSLEVVPVVESLEK